MSDQSPLRLAILMPVRDDWKAALELISRLDETLSGCHCSPEIILVDDHSLQRANPSAFSTHYKTLQGIRVLRLRRNLGHQRSIAIGLVSLELIRGFDSVIVMDADGEDTPDGVAELIGQYRQAAGSKAVFAERIRRSESLTFRCSYQLYRQLHFLLTGIEVKVGNFSILPAEYLSTLVIHSELWNHYAATVFRSRLPFAMVPIARGHRIAGKSTMNFVALVMHGLSAISVFGDIVGVRILIGSLFCAFLAAVAIAVVIGVRVFTDLAIPGWATNATGVLAMVMIQLVSIASSFTFFVLTSRSNPGFIPLRDSEFFVEGSVTIYTR